MIDEISRWARRASDPCLRCGAKTDDPCTAHAAEARIFPLDGGSPVHLARIVAHPVSAALWALKAAAADPRSAEAFDALLAAATVAIAELAAHDRATARVLFETYAQALGRASGAA